MKKLRPGQRYQATYLNPGPRKWQKQLDSRARALNSYYSLLTLNLPINFSRSPFLSVFYSLLDLILASLVFRFPNQYHIRTGFLIKISKSEILKQIRFMVLGPFTQFSCFHVQKVRYYDFLEYSLVL